jgi:hypothetical protein
MIRRKSKKTVLISGERSFPVVACELQVERRGGSHVRADVGEEVGVRELWRGQVGGLDKSVAVLRYPFVERSKSHRILIYIKGQGRLTQMHRPALGSR